MTRLEHVTQRIDRWVRDTFGHAFMDDRGERVRRLLEETCELAQAAGLSRADCDAILDRVFRRDVGDIDQETAGVGVTFLAWVRHLGGDPDVVRRIEAEVDRIEKIDGARIREKHKGKVLDGSSKLLPREP